MKCPDPECTGHHDRNHWDTLCPRSKEAGLARDRKRYDAQSWLEHHAKQLKGRRLRAVQRMKERGA
jgi:hypothetical protein